MPPNLRGDFIYVGPPGYHVMSNNPTLLKYVSFGAAVQRNAPQGQVPAKTTAPLKKKWSYSSSCSPPDPPRDGNGNPNPRGAYVRQVSQCGFTAAWAFVNVPCGNTMFAAQNGQQVDAGFLYFEIRGSQGSLTEGGLQYNRDNDPLGIQPYVAAPTGRPTLNNGTAKYGCGQDLGILHGITADAKYTYTAIGQVPAGVCSPETNFCNGNTFQFNNQAWIFQPAYGDILYSANARDRAGNVSPCIQCSITKVTSIAQTQTQDYQIDGSYFGLNFGASQPMIHWMQVAFGEWESDCTPGTSLCTFDYSADPTIYYGGTQNYPNDLVAQDILSPFGFGPYESFASIDLSCGGCQRSKPAAAFREPPPPLPCTADSQGNCTLLQARTVTSSCNTGWTGIHGQPVFEHGYTVVYSVYRKGYPAHYLETSSDTERLTAPQNPPGHCTKQSFWSPGEPRVQYGDPNLP